MTTEPSQTTIDWSTYKRYCGSGVMEYWREPNNEGPIPYGVRVSLVPNYKTTPAEEAGIKEGDVITHSWHNGRWIRHYDYSMDPISPFLGAVGTVSHLRVHTPGEAEARIVSVRREWVLEVFSHDPLFVGRTPQEVQKLVSDNLHLIPKRSQDDETCELMASVPMESLMNLAAPHIRATSQPQQKERA